MDDARPSNRETENENQRPDRAGQPPRPATEPKGQKASTRKPGASVDPGSGKSLA
jgi:hypothetical protein